MPKKPQKIEEILDVLYPEASYEPKPAVDLDISKDSKDVSFPQILDFAFPKGVGSTKITQIGEVTYVGDGIIHVAGLDRATIDEIIEVKTHKGTIEKAMVLGVQEEKIEAVVLGNYYTSVSTRIAKIF